MTGARTADERNDETLWDNGRSPDPMAPVISEFRKRMTRKLEYWKSKRELTDDEQAAVEFWEDYFRAKPQPPSFS